MGLSMLEHGAYRLLMDAYYASEAPIPADDVYVIAKAITAPERKAVDKVLKKFDLRDGVYVHKRIEEEIASYRMRSKTGSNNIRKRYPKHTETLPPVARDSVPLGVVLASSHKPETQPPEQAASVVETSRARDPRCAALASLCSQNRVTLDARGELHLSQWANEGVSTETFGAAIRVARQRKPDPEIIPFAYLVPIVTDLRAGKISPPAMSTDEAIRIAMANIAAKERSEAPAGGAP